MKKVYVILGVIATWLAFKAWAENKASRDEVRPLGL